MKAAPLVLVAALTATSLACATTLERGESRYQQGDRIGALELWRSIPADGHDAETARRRIAEVEDEQQALVARYLQRGAYFERKGRLAEAILSLRVAARLDPSDAQTPVRVLELSRALVEQKAALTRQWQEALAGNRLVEAREKVRALRDLDPFDPAGEDAERRVTAALDAEIERRLALGREGFSGGDYETATLRFREVLVIAPEQESARGYLAYIERIRESEKNRPALAPAPAPDRTAARRARALRTSDPQIRAEGFHQNALSAERAGDPYAAIAHELRAIEIDPEHAAAKRNLAVLRERLGPEVPGLIDAGRVAFQQEDLDGAIDHWRRALLVEPGNERATQYAERARRLLQNLEQLRAEPDPVRAVGSRP